MKININYKGDEFTNLESQLIGGETHFRHISYFKKMMDMLGN